MTSAQMKYEFEVGYDRITNFDAPGYEPKEISTFLTKSQLDVTYKILEESSHNERSKKSLSRLKDVLTLSTFTTGNYLNGYKSELKASVIGITLDFTTGAGGTITDSGSGFVTAGFRAGDVITVSGADTSANDGTYTIASVVAGTITISGQEEFDTVETGLAGTEVYTDPILRVINEVTSLDVTSLTHKFYSLNAGHTIEDLEVVPIDDDYYHANKKNPYKKPNERKIWRVDTSTETKKLHEYIINSDYTINEIKLFIFRKPRPIIIADTEYAKVTDGQIDGEWFIDRIDGLDCKLDPSIHREIVDGAVKLAFAALQDEKGFQISSAQEQQK